ncbi:BgTH12-03614 [Blumeria graminis f. sp. triticale]|uniref:BgTH12-03614 n=1 Tax=Blumeria graminis f. sp. triticale TaxID=1689686 RepID=A0A9W4D034_BLUGR|nr:BgTH12-03614 [Blumeria graminis f. sp. triticale]
MSDVSEASPGNPPQEKSKQKCRPPVSGTELDLRANRKNAQTALRKSQQQERIYVTKKQASFAKSEAHKAKMHFRLSQKNFKIAVVCTMSAVRNYPAIIREKMDVKRQKKMERNVVKAENTRKTLEEIAGKRSRAQSTA